MKCLVKFSCSLVGGTSYRGSRTWFVLLVLLLFVSHLLEATMAASIQPPGKQPRLQKASFSSRLQDSSFVALHPTAMSA